MKKSLLLVAVVALLSSCGGDNSGGGSPDVPGLPGGGSLDVSGLPEGTGAQLDLATTDSAKKTEIANLLEQIIEGGGDIVENVDSSASVGQSMGKAVSGNSMSGILCSSGSYSKTYQDVIFKGHSSGEVSISGSVNAKVSDDHANIKTSFDGIFTNYGTYIYKNSKSVNLTGTINSDNDFTISSGLKAICDFVQYGTKPTQATNGTANGSGHLVGALSLSGGVGGALAFDITVTASYAVAIGGNTEGTSDITVNGVATLKSGGTTITCSVSRNSASDTDIDNYKVTCE